MVSDPLTLYMCSSIGDGAAALFICSEEYAATREIRRIYIRASSIVSATADGSGELVAVRAAKAAYEEAGIGPSEVHVVELHDVSAPAELIH